MAENSHLRSFGWIASKLTASRIKDRQNLIKAFWRLGQGLTLILVFSGSVASLVGYFLFKGIPRSGVNDITVQMRKGTVLPEDSEAAAFAPSTFQAGFEWHDGRMGVVLTWDPAPYKVRIYRMPFGQLKYIEANGRVARSFDFNITPGRKYVYVACALAEKQAEYCSEPIGYEVLGTKRR